MQKKPKLGLSLMPTADYHQATKSLIENNQVQVVEWGFDFSWDPADIEPWCRKVIDHFSESNSLIGHGVSFSLLSARFSDRQRDWLANAKKEFKRRNYIHATEHFGFSEAGPVVKGAPLAVPMNAESLGKGKEMMKRFSDAARCPVGLENLAFAFGLEDVKRQGDFINQLISHVDGFLLLDLHNIFCQLENFDVSLDNLLNSYPLDKVREIHVSGGSWSQSVSGKNRVFVRRDTHDEAVPQEVFNLVGVALKLCPNIEYVILERLGNTMEDKDSQEEFRQDYETLVQILELNHV